MIDPQEGVNITFSCEHDDASNRVVWELLINVDVIQTAALWDFCCAVMSGLQTISSLATHLHTPAVVQANEMLWGSRGRRCLHSKDESRWGERTKLRRWITTVHTRLNGIIWLVLSHRHGEWCNKLTASTWTLQRGGSEPVEMHTCVVSQDLQNIVKLIMQGYVRRQKLHWQCYMANNHKSLHTVINFRTIGWFHMAKKVGIIDYSSILLTYTAIFNPNCENLKRCIAEL